jgi:hypothetical protein
MIFFFIFQFGSKKQIPEIPTVEVGKRKCQVILHYLGTLHHQAFGQAIKSNVKQISRTFSIVSS